MTDLFTLSEQILTGERGIDEHHPLQIGASANLQAVTGRVAFVESFANVIATRTDDGLVIVDAGSPLHAAAIVESVRDWSADRLHTAVFTHGHVDHIYAVKLFESEGNGPARVLAHEALPARFRRYDEALARHALRTVFVLRLIFWMPQALHGFLGVSKVSFRDHFWGSLLGYIPPLLMVSYFAAEVFDASGALQPRAFTLLGALLAGSLVLAWWLRRDALRGR